MTPERKRQALYGLEFDSLRLLLYLNKVFV